VSEFDDSMTYCLWSCACAAQQARNAESDDLRKFALARAAEYADKAWAIYYQKYPKATETTSEVAA